MKRISTPTVVAATAALILGLAGCASVPAPAEAENVITYRAEYPEFENLSTLESDADVVATISLTGNARTYELAPLVPENPTDPVENPAYGAPAGETAEAPPIIVTAYEAQIVEVIKGQAQPGDIIEIKQLGGEADGVEYVAPDEQSLGDTETALVFLRSWGGEPYSLLSPNDALLPQAESGEYQVSPLSDLEATETEIEQLITE